MTPAERERQIWLLDQEINQRGFFADLELARASLKATRVEKERLDQTVQDISMGTIRSATQREKLKDFLGGCGLDLPNMQAGTLDKVLQDGDELHEEVRALLQARAQVSKSSTAKYEKILGAVGTDGRLRGSLQFSGAKRTARWAGRIFQPHNLPRPKMKNDEILQAIRALKAGTADLITDNLHQMCSDTLRGLLIAPEGRTLLVGDYNAIEGRVTAWLAGEEWKLKTYADPEADIYIDTYRAMFGLMDDIEVSKDQRQQGKCFELSMGYEGGVGALVSSAKTYGVDLQKLAKGAWAVAPVHIKKYARKLQAFAVIRGDTLAMNHEVLYTKLEAAKLMWRELSPGTVKLWKLYREAAFQAVREPGRKLSAGKCVFYCKGGFLIVRMPSGRSLLYAKPKIRKRPKKGGKVDEELSYLLDYGGRQHLYGGILTENIVQATARDVLAEAMLRVAKAGFEIILTVHDEIICEIDKARAKKGLRKMFDLMEVIPSWAYGLPLRVEGYCDVRYKKD